MSSVSVVMPCYRYGHYLEEAVGSCLDDQPGVDVKVLIIDDASGDGSAEVALDIAARDPRVEVIVHETNRGHIATYNEGLLGWADGDYTVLLSADDRLAPGALRRAADLLDAHPNVGFVYGNVLWFTDAAPLPRARATLRGSSVWPGQVWLEERFRRAQSGVSSPEVVVRTSLQQSVGGYDLRLPHLADTQMWIRLAARADVGYLHGVDQAYYRRHGSNMSTAYTPLPTLYQYRLAYESALASIGPDVVDADRLSELVHRKLAREALLAAARAYDKGRVSETPVDDLMAFAVSCWPAARTLPVYQSLQLRRRIGTRMMPYLQPLVLPAAAARKAESWWQRRGEQSFGEQFRRWWLRNRAVKHQGLTAAPALSAMRPTP